ncbi:MAG: alpha-hydroxy-acid oxidizing protein [Rhizobiaceae bacterium]|nr:alpha-hydroxy-acid oxidizing protein [Rhizobiaceae bacterium]
MKRYLSLNDFEQAARRRLPGMLYAFVSNASETGSAASSNQASFAEYEFLPRVLRDVSQRSQSVVLFGRRYAAPFGIAPMGAQAIFGYRADIAMARAAATADVPMILSGSSLIPMEEVRRQGSTAWFQAYLAGEAHAIEGMLDRVAAAGFDTFVLAVDVPVSASTENYVRSGFSQPLRPSFGLAWQGIVHPSWLFSTLLQTLLKHGMPHFENMAVTRGPAILSRHLQREIGQRSKLSWDHMRLIRKRWHGKLILKGILSPDDTRMARECGVDGIIVSNHGGRSLDSAIAPLRALPAVRDAADGMTVMLDGGIRRGTDVLKALSLGADFVFLGRPFSFAAAVGGEMGVSRAIALLSAEVDRDLALLGASSLAELSPEFLVRTSHLVG